MGEGSRDCETNKIHKGWEEARLRGRSYRRPTKTPSRAPMEVIDLCTPPGSPAADKENVVALGKRKAVAPPAVELAEDCDSDCEIVEPPMQQHHGGSVAAGGDDGAEEHVDEMDDDEVAVVPPPASAPMPQTSGIEAEDDEIQFVGRTGHIALSE